MILGLLVVSLSVAIFDKKKSQNLTFRKPRKFVYLELTSSENPQFMRNFVHVVSISSGTLCSVCATSVQQNRSHLHNKPSQSSPS